MWTCFFLYCWVAVCRHVDPFSILFGLPMWLPTWLPVGSMLDSFFGSLSGFLSGFLLHFLSGSLVWQPFWLLVRISFGIPSFSFRRRETEVEEGMVHFVPAIATLLVEKHERIHTRKTNPSSSGFVVLFASLCLSFSVSLQTLNSNSKLHTKKTVPPLPKRKGGEKHH